MRYGWANKSEKGRFYYSANTKWNIISMNKFRSQKRVYSKDEIKLRDILKELIPEEEVIYCCRDVLPHLELDIYFPKLRLAFEYNGYHHFHNPQVKRNDKLKDTLCKKLDIILFIITKETLNKSHLLDELKATSKITPLLQMKSMA